MNLRDKTKVSKRTLVAFFLGVLIAGALLGGALTLMANPNGDATYITAGSFKEGYSYLLSYKNATHIEMQNGTTGTVDAISTNPVTLIQWAWNNMSNTGGTVFFKPGNYPGTGYLQKPDGSFSLEGESGWHYYTDTWRTSFSCYGINATGTGFLGLKNLMVSNSNPDYRPWFILCDGTEADFHHVRIGNSKARCAIALEVRWSGRSHIEDVEVRMYSGCTALYVGQDWFTSTGLFYAWYDGMEEYKCLLDADAASGQKIVSVEDAQMWCVNDHLIISDSANSETNSIASIDVASNNLTMKNNLANTYTVANGAKINSTDMSCINVGGISPATGLGPHDADGAPWGVNFDLIHIFGAGTNTANYSLYWSCQAGNINTLDSESTVATTAFIWMYGGLHIGTLYSGSGTKMLDGNHETTFKISIDMGPMVVYNSKINILNASHKPWGEEWKGYWNSTDPGTQIGAFVYIPSGTEIVANNSYYNLYNLWMSGGTVAHAKSRTQVRVEPVSDIPWWLDVYAYDDHDTEDNRMRWVVQNIAGSNQTLTADAVFFVKIC